MYKTKWLSLLLVLTLIVALTLTGCGGGNNNTPDPDEEEGITVKIGSQGYPEVEILAELAKALVEENTPHKVEHVRNLGSSLGAHEATIAGQLDMNNNFTGTLFLGLYEQDGLTDEWRDPDKVHAYLQEHMLEDYGMFVFPSYGYNNTYAIAVPRTWAEENNVTKQSDLEPFAKDMTLAVTPTWLNYPGQGYPEYTELYGFSFKNTVEMNTGLMYIAIANDEVDAINSYSTDGQLVSGDLIALEDDKGFNPPYYGVLIANNDMLEENPDIKEALMGIADLINTEQMQQLNKLVAVDEQEPEAVAQNFLREKGLIK